MSVCRVLLGVTGGIAAYKSPVIVRRLIDRGVTVRCALTQSAASFVSPLTLEVVSGNAVMREEYLQATGSGVERHVEAAAWAQTLCVAPCTANTLVRLANGLADDFLTTVASMFTGPLVVAPAMHSTMWEQPAVRTAVALLEARGARIVGPATGALASGATGIGRLAEPEDIVSAVLGALHPRDFAGLTVGVSAGPTFEAIDPVRFLGNRSSGRMGYSVAKAAAQRGAGVVLVSGPVDLPPPLGVDVRKVDSAAEMKEAVEQVAPSCDLFVMAAAVADYRPAQTMEQKIKKADNELRQLALVENPDILAGLRDLCPRGVLVGFAAETSDLLENAQNKLVSKRLDFLVANDVSRGDIGFGSSDNEVAVLGAGTAVRHLPRMDKEALAHELLSLFRPVVAERQ